MSEQEVRVPRWVYHAPCQGEPVGHFDPDFSCERMDWDGAWQSVARSGFNAEMYLRSSHTDTEWVFVLDTEAVNQDTPGMEIEWGGEPTTLEERNARPAGKITPFFRNDQGVEMTQEEYEAYIAAQTVLVRELNNG